MKKTITRSLLSLLFTIFLTLAFNTSANAASCKGKSQSSCSASSSCNWVKGYKRKDGVKVSSHCRAASGKAKKEKTKKSVKKTSKSTGNKTTTKKAKKTATKKSTVKKAKKKKSTKK